jgi:predicted Zn-dependent peptidase
MDTVRSVALGLWFAVGSRDEAAGEAGMSHFMEHMMFKGTPARSASDISETFDRLGAELNAFTSKEYTCFYSRLLDEHVETAVEVLGDMVTNSLLADEAIVSEREVVLEEISRHEDTPDDQVHDIFSQTLMPSHPLGLPILGRRETVGAFDHTSAADFHRRHYGTGNLVVAAAGALEHERIVEMVRAHLSLPVAPRSARTTASPTTTRQVRVLKKDTEQAHICWGVTALHARHEDRFTLAILDGVLGGGMASRLFQEIREKRGLAYAVYSYHALYQDTGEFVIYAGTRPDNAPDVLRLIREVVDGLTADGISDDELHRVREGIKGQMVLGLEATRSRMTRLGKSEVTGAELLSIDEIVERVDAVTVEGVNALARQLFDGNHALAMIAPIAEEDIAHLV